MQCHWLYLRRVRTYVYVLNAAKPNRFGAKMVADLCSAIEYDKNRIILAWKSGHSKIKGNAIADQLFEAGPIPDVSKDKETPTMKAQEIVN